MTHVKQIKHGYDIFYIGEQRNDVVVKHNSGKIVGVYFTEVLEVLKGHQGQGLAIAMILEAVQYRDPPEIRKVSEAGEAALRKAWRVANGK